MKVLKKQHQELEKKVPEYNEEMFPKDQFGEFCEMDKLLTSEDYSDDKLGNMVQLIENRKKKYPLVS